MARAGLSCAVMKLATWNVNSIRARLERVLAWTETNAPDVLCLQEIKVEDDVFPAGAFEDLGYHAVVHGQRTYNGVAILSKTPPEDPWRGLDDGVDDPQARLVGARVDGVRVLCAYVPNGEYVGSVKWTYKLAWLERLGRFLEARCDPAAPLVLCGDLNIAPEPRDVKNPEKWEKTVLFHPEARAALETLSGFGLADALRLHHEEDGIYSWWDYRMLGFPKNDGLRIDHVLVTEPMAARCTDCFVDREARKGPKPSDHAPVVALFD